MSNLDAGTYRVEIDAYFSKPDAVERWDVERRKFVHAEKLEVHRDIDGLLLRPVPVVDPPEKK